MNFTIKDDAERVTERLDQLLFENSLAVSFDSLGPGEVMATIISRDDGEEWETAKAPTLFDAMVRSVMAIVGSLGDRWCDDCLGSRLSGEVHYGIPMSCESCCEPIADADDPAAGNAAANAGQPRR